MSYYNCTKYSCVRTQASNTPVRGNLLPKVGPHLVLILTRCESTRVSGYPSTVKRVVRYYMILLDDVLDSIFQNDHTGDGAYSSQQGSDTCVAVMFKNTNISTWLDALFMYPVRVRMSYSEGSSQTHCPQKCISKYLHNTKKLHVSR